MALYISSAYCLFTSVIRYCSSKDEMYVVKVIL